MPLSPEAAVFLEFNRRFQTILRLMNVSDLERLIATALLQDSAPWPFKTLAEYVNAPRSTTRNAALDLCRMGLCDIDGRGVLLNSRGRSLFADATNEAYEVAAGRRPGLSRELLDRFRALPSEGVRRPFHTPDSLRTLRFSPLDASGVMS